MNLRNPNTIRQEWVGIPKQVPSGFNIKYVGKIRCYMGRKYYAFLPGDTQRYLQLKQISTLDKSRANQRICRMSAAWNTSKTKL